MADSFTERLTAEDKPALEKMRTQELEELLRQDAHSSCGSESNLELIEYVLEVMERRERLRPQNALPDVDAAWASFQENYLPDVSPLICEEPAASKTEQLHALHPTPKRTRRRLRPLFAAAIICVVLFGSLAARAMGVDLLEVFARWTSDLFHFGGSGEGFQPPMAADAEVDYPSLKEALLACQTSAQIAPTWWPEGYELVNLVTWENTQATFIKALYHNGANTLCITVRLYPKEEDISATAFEKDEAGLEKYRKNGITHYLMENLRKASASWVNGRAVCSVSGKITLQQLKKMIDSIYKG